MKSQKTTLIGEIMKLSALLPSEISKLRACTEKQLKYNLTNLARVKSNWNDEGRVLNGSLNFVDQ